MILPTGSKPIRGSGSPPRGGGFTLIELILVMATLAIVLSLVAPSLARFFRGRSLDSEARRFLTLARYGHSRAVAEGEPMVLWIDPQRAAYGLQTEGSYSEIDAKAVQFELGINLQIEVELPIATVQSVQWKRTAQIAGNRPAIRFTPDGFISETSPGWVLFRSTVEDDAVWIGQSRNRLDYEIQTNSLALLRR